MTPNHDHASLFVAPRSASGTEAAGNPWTAADDDKTMLRLRHPFAVDMVPPRPEAVGAKAAPGTLHQA